MTGLVYDGTLQTGVEGSEFYTLSAYQFVGAGNYVATATPADGYNWIDGSTEPKDIPWSIAQKELTVTGMAAADKTYDGTTDAEIAGGELVGVIAEDDGEVSIEALRTTGSFENKNAGTGKAVTFAPMTLTGAKAPNYTLIQPTLTANITKAPLTVTADDKEVENIYDYRCSRTDCLRKVRI